MSDRERVADAIRQTWTKQISGGLPPVTWQQLSRSERERWLEVADAALAEVSPRGQQ